MRTLVALLLVFGFAATRPVACARPAQGAEDTPRLTAEEEKEASAFAADFEKRLYETNDIQPLIDETFVADFADRFEAVEAPGHLIFIQVEDGVEKQLDRQDRMRAYVVSMNFYFLLSRLSVAALDARVRDGRCKIVEEDEAGCEPKYSELFPPSVAEVFDHNPLLAGLVEELVKEEDSNDESRGERDAQGERTVESVEQFRGLLETLEEAEDKMREQLKSAPSLASTRETLADFRAKRAKAGESNEDSSEDDARPRLTILSNEFFGYPAGTRVICVTSVMPFHLDLVRVGGQLKVAAAYFEDD